MNTLRSINPVTGEVVTEVPATSPAAVAAAAVAARAAFEEWSRAGVAARARPLLEAARLLRAEVEAHAALMAREMGKPVAQGAAEVEKCASACEHFAAVAEACLATETVATEAAWSGVAYRPLGVLLAVMPWNYPFWQVFRCAVPALMAGNVVLLKHAAGVAGCALAVADLLRRAGLPDGVFQALFIDHQGVADLIASPRVQAVALTGSTRAGREVAAAAGRALKPSVLELGGSDPYVVLADADLPRTVETCAAARLVNGGQSCIAAKRFIVEESVLEEFTERLAAAFAARRMGEPFAPGVDLGPQARVDLRDALHDQVVRSLGAGARLRCGGQVPPESGAFYPPTVLDRVRPGMAAADEEVFGPVAAVLGAAGEAEAVALANATPFGLGAAVFTADVERGRRLAERELHAGACFVNAFVRSDPRLPFGGVKDSGWGRELGLPGLRQLVNVKTVWIG